MLLVMDNRNVRREHGLILLIKREIKKDQDLKMNIQNYI